MNRFERWTEVILFTKANKKFNYIVISGLIPSTCIYPNHFSFLRKLNLKTKGKIIFESIPPNQINKIYNKIKIFDLLYLPSNSTENQFVIIRNYYLSFQGRPILT